MKLRNLVALVAITAALTSTATVATLEFVRPVSAGAQSSNDRLRRIDQKLGDMRTKLNQMEKHLFEIKRGQSDFCKVIATDQRRPYCPTGL